MNYQEVSDTLIAIREEHGTPCPEQREDLQRVLHLLREMWWPKEGNEELYTDEPDPSLGEFVMLFRDGADGVPKMYFSWRRTEKKQLQECAA